MLVQCRGLGFICILVFQITFCVGGQCGLVAKVMADGHLTSAPNPATQYALTLAPMPFSTADSDDQADKVRFRRQENN